MTASHVLHSQHSASVGTVGPEACTLAVGAAHSLHPKAAMVLRVVSGQAWVTLNDRPHGWCEESGDVVLHPGQSVGVAPGQHAVVEPMGPQPLQYQWRRAGAAQAQPAAPRRQAAAADRDTCCA
jgi:mannose-6-phosphate isomerase-like protein (cupin superfamily)